MVGMGSLCVAGAHVKELLLTPNSVLLVRGMTLLGAALVTALVRGTLLRLLLQSDTTDRNLSGFVGSSELEEVVDADGSGDLWPRTSGTAGSRSSRKL